MSKSTVFSRLLKILLWSVGLLLSVALILPIAAILFFDPNEFKPQIAGYITEKTHLPLALNGDITLQIFPWVGLNAKDVDLVQEAQFGEGALVHIGEMGLQIPLRELLHWHLKIESLSLKEVDIQLTKGTNGTTNWDHLHFTDKDKDKNIEKEKKDNIASSAKAKKNKLTFALEKFEINNATVRYEDKQQKQIITLSKLSLKGNGTSEATYPIKGQLALNFLENNQTPALQGSGEFSGNIVIQKNAFQQATLDTKISIDLPKQYADWQHPTLAMQLQISQNKTITLKNIDLHAGKLHATGEATIPNDSTKTPIRFSATMNQLDLDKLPSTANSPNPTLAVSSAGNATASAPSAKTVAQSAPMRPILGEIRVQQLSAKKLTLSNVKTTLRLENNLITLQNLSGDFYQGKLQAQLSKNLANTNAPLAIQGKMTDVQLEALLKDLNKKPYITGKTTLDFNLTHQAKAGLDGLVSIKASNGSLQGIDIKYYLNAAEKLFKHGTSEVANTKSTPFTDLSASLKISNNIIYNNDLSIIGQDFKASGEGSIDLNSQGIQFKVQAWRQYQDGGTHENSYPLALRIKGTLEHPKVEPDVDLYLKTIVNRELKKQLKKQLGGNDEQSTNEQSTNEQIKEKINQELGKSLEKGLKKLFKK